jgi:hypothetical protein
VSLGFTQQGQHQAMAVDDAGGRRPECCLAVQRGLQTSCGQAVEKLKVIHTVGAGVGFHLGESANLLCRGGDHQLAATAVCDAVAPAEGIELVPPLNAHPRPEGPRGVVKTRMDDLAVAGTGGGAKGVLRFQDDDFTALQRQGAGTGQPYHTCADHDAVCLFHGDTL